MIKELNEVSKKIYDICVKAENEKWSFDHLIDHLQNLVNTKAKEGEVYDFAKKEKVKTQCVQIFSKAMDGPYGVFGNINPQKIRTEVDEIPF